MIHEWMTLAGRVGIDPSQLSQCLRTPARIWPIVDKTVIGAAKPSNRGTARQVVLASNPFMPSELRAFGAAL